MRLTGWRPLLALAGALILPAGAQAQEGFMFRAPQAQITLRFGESLPRASGALYDDMRHRLTLGTGDFAAEAVAVDMMFRTVPDIDVGASFQWAQSNAHSEYRDLVYDNNDPIQQTTRLGRYAGSLLLRGYPLGRGESLAKYAWVPKSLTPFVGGGLGVVWYRLRQTGDFVNETTYDIFGNSYESKGSALAAHLLAGTDFWFSPAVGLSLEGRYTFASDEPGGDYARSSYNPTGYTEIDLSGAVLTAGLTFRF